MSNSDNVSTDAYDAEEQFTIYTRRDGDRWIAYEHDSDHVGQGSTQAMAIAEYAAVCDPRGRVDVSLQGTEVPADD